jgi:hypothetical protein
MKRWKNVTAPGAHDVGRFPLELDHIDGDRWNSELSNLRLICPNCHAFTPTYRGRNKAFAAKKADRIAAP